MRTVFRTLVIAICLISVFSLESLYATEEKAAKLLKQAWKEYKFREFGSAYNLFLKAEQEALSKKTTCQAITGQAFYYHFGQKGQASSSDYETAIALYKRGLESADKDVKMQSFFKSMIAECKYYISKLEKDDEILEEAEEMWNDIQKHYYGSVVAQDSLLFRVVIQCDDFNSETCVENSKELENYLVPIINKVKHNHIDDELKENVLLTPVMANYLGSMYFWQNDFKNSVNYYKMYCRLGPTSFQYKSNAIFKIARISETKLDDRKTARRYYTRLYLEAASDKRAYFAMEKVKSFDKESE